MARILILKYLYNLSEEQMEFQLLDSMSYERFRLIAAVPHRNTLWHFKHLGVDGVTAIFQAVDGQLLHCGYLLGGGRPSTRHWCQHPTSASPQKTWPSLSQGRIKDGKSYHGYRLSTRVGVAPKFIRKITTGTASEHNSMHFDELLYEHNTSGDLHAERGYPRAQRSQMVKTQGFTKHVQRKAKLGKPLSKC